MKPLAVAFVLCAAVTARAEAGLADASDKALPCRPTIACTADFVPPGTLEIELGYIARAFDHGSWQHSTPLLVKLTLAEWAQLQIGSNGFVAGAPSPLPLRYVDDVTAGLKLHLADQARTFPSLSFSAGVSIPTAAQPGYIRTWDLAFIAYITKDLRWLHADLNVGLNLWRVDGSPLLQAWIALALSVELPRRFGVMLEGYYFTDASPVDVRDAGVLAAIAWAPRSWLVLDVGGDAGLGVPRRGSLFAGMTIVPARLWGKHEVALP